MNFNRRIQITPEQLKEIIVDYFFDKENIVIKNVDFIIQSTEDFYGNKNSPKLTNIDIEYEQ